MNVDRRSIRKSTSDYYLVYEDSTDELIGRVVNLSLDGTMLIGDHEMVVPTRIDARLELNDPIDGRKQIRFQLESRWCKKNETCDWYETGYKFVEISDQDRNLIAKLTRGWIEQIGTSQESRGADTAMS